LQREKEDAKKLKDLRKLAVFGFIMVNALFVLFIFLFQVNSDDLDEVCTLYTN
jgi:hypothetical protein